MASLQLWFIRGQLSKTEFAHPLLSEVLTAHRGRIIGSMNSFPWSAGVQAVCFLLVESVLAMLRKEEPFWLEGERGSFACALDSSITKRTNWLSDIFGADSKGTLLAQRLFHRTNSCLKRIGPVGVSLNTHQLDASHISIFVDGMRAVEVGQLESIRDALIGACQKTALVELPVSPRIPSDNAPTKAEALPEWNERVDEFVGRQRDLGPLPKPFWDPVAKSFLEMIFADEVHRMLQGTNIFSQSKFNQTVTEVLQLPWCKTLAKRHSQLVSDVDLRLTCAERVGCVNRPELKEILDTNPIRVALSPTYAPSVALFTFLKLFKGYNIEVLYQFSNSYEVVKAIEGSNREMAPNACVLSVAAAEEMVKSHRALQFAPLMLMPNISHRIVAPRSPTRAKQKFFDGHYLFWSGTPSGPLLYYSRLKQQRIIRETKAKITHLEPDRIAAALNDGDADLRGILWFPFYHFNAQYNGCSLLDDGNSSSLTPQLLFVEQSMFSHPSVAFHLDVAIRDAWLELLETPGLIPSVVRVMLEDRGYIRLLCRFGGLHNQQAYQRMEDTVSPLKSGKCLSL